MKITCDSYLLRDYLNQFILESNPEKQYDVEIVDSYLYIRGFSVVSGLYVNCGGDKQFSIHYRKLNSLAIITNSIPQQAISMMIKDQSSEINIILSI
jgi:hypothetical protein